MLTSAKGYGALVINTHRLNSIVFDGKRTLSDGHKGGVVTVGAGVMFQDLYAQAWPKNLDVLGGECPVSLFPVVPMVETEYS
jgi:FAD/FMN-containing dehydrogenase